MTNSNLIILISWVWGWNHFWPIKSRGFECMLRSDITLGTAKLLPLSGEGLYQVYFISKSSSEQFKISNF